MNAVHTAGQTLTGRSCLYECRVMHHRLSPKRHRFEYGIFMALLDLDELDSLTARLRLFGRNRSRPYNFRDDDHLRMRIADCGVRNGAPVGGSKISNLKSEIRAWLASQGVKTTKDCRICLLTLPRVFGYVFNPVSFYFVETAAGEPICAVAEVGNTFGELKPYLVPVDEAQSSKLKAQTPANFEGHPASNIQHPAAAFHRVAPKHFYVSPFSALDLSFDFRLRTPGDQLQLGVNDVTADGQTVLISTVTGTRRPLTDGQLLRLTARYPLVTLHVIALIHWHALKLWWKRLPLHRKAENPELQRDVFRRHPESTAAQSDSLTPKPVSLP